MQHFRYRRLWWLIGFVGIGVLIYFSLTPMMVRLPISYGDKLGHFLAYAALAGWFAQLLRSPWLLTACATGLFALGVCLEFLQQLTGRHFEYQDMMANALGVVVGLLLGRVLGVRMLQKLERAFFV